MIFIGMDWSETPPLNYAEFVSTFIFSPSDRIPNLLLIHFTTDLRL